MSDVDKTSMPVVPPGALLEGERLEDLPCSVPEAQEGHAGWVRPKNLPSHSKPLNVRRPRGQRIGLVGVALPHAMLQLEMGAIGLAREAERVGGLDKVSVDARCGIVPLGAFPKSKEAKAAADDASKRAPRCVSLAGVPIGEWILGRPRDSEAQTMAARKRLFMRLDVDRDRRLDAFEARQKEVQEFRKKERQEIFRRWRRLDRGLPKDESGEDEDAVEAEIQS